MICCISYRCNAWTPSEFAYVRVSWSDRRTLCHSEHSRTASPRCANVCDRVTAKVSRKTYRKSRNGVWVRELEYAWRVLACWRKLCRNGDISLPVGCPDFDGFVCGGKGSMTSRSPSHTRCTCIVAWRPSLECQMHFYAANVRHWWRKRRRCNQWLRCFVLGRGDAGLGPRDDVLGPRDAWICRDSGPKLDTPPPPARPRIVFPRALPAAEVSLRSLQ